MRATTACRYGSAVDPAALLLEAGRGRRALKRLAVELDSEPTSRAALAEALGLPADWPAKRLLRHGLGRSEDARRRQNPVRRDESFDCGACGAAVAPGGARVRDHCPRCLFSLHVDVVPGDRASDCGELLEPVGLETIGQQTVIQYRCRGCGHRQRNRAHDEDDIVALARRLSGDVTG